MTFYLFIYSSLLPLCNRLGYERPTPPPSFFNRYQHPFGHTGEASEIILTDQPMTLYNTSIIHHHMHTGPLYSIVSI
jgi:hypothetical protein